MKDEIKGILDEIKDYSEHEYLPPCCELTNEECKQLLDYITNLQNQLEEKTYLYNKLDTESKYAITNLQEENEIRQQDINNLTYQLAKEKSRINKVNEIIDEVLFVGVKDYRSQLEIIQKVINGGDNNE